MPTVAISPAIDAARRPAGVLQAVTDVHACMLAKARLLDASHALARGAKKELRFERVCVGLLRGAVVDVVGDSGLPAALTRPADDPRIAAAMTEALDQRACVTVPEPAFQTLPRIVQFHQALLDGSIGGVLSVPMSAHGRQIGAITALRRGATTISADDVDALAHLASLAGPVLHLMQANERPAWQRGRDALAEGWRAGARERPWFKPAMVAAGIGLLVLLFVPFGASVGGHARLEGAVQQVLVAPSDGFLKLANARPGDLVQKGQVLVEFAQQDLLLDRERWASQLEQHETGLAAANARRDRAQLVINQSRAAEAEAQLALADMKIARSVLLAPFDGIVVRGDLSQQIGAPVQQGAELMTLAPSDRFRVMVEVDERDIALVQVGNAGAVTLSALPWDTLPLRVTRITPMATAVEGANVFEVEAELLAHPADLRPGLQGNARIDIGRQPLAWGGLRRVLDAIRLTAWKWFG
jgi:multidrug efflux pump subunit AcrA (membrane-fusion protein)